MGYLKAEIRKLGIDVKDEDFDRSHRMSTVYEKNGNMYQPVILRMCSWRARNEIFKNRKKLPFFVKADLTKLRQLSYDWAVDDLKNSNSSHKVVDYIFVDENCKLKMKTKSKKYLGFSNFNEYLSLVIRLSKDIPYTGDIIAGDPGIESDSEH